MSSVLTILFSCDIGLGNGIKRSKKMPIISANCPRCHTQNMTFDVNGYNDLGVGEFYSGQGTLREYEIFAVCKKCKGATTFCVIEPREIAQGRFIKPENVMKITDSLNRYFRVFDFVRSHGNPPQSPPDSIPDTIKAVFQEGAACFSIGCWNATGAMFRTCLDLASKDKIQGVNETDITKHQRENMAARIEWLFEKKRLPENLKDLADCIRQDGNDGAHDGTLGKDEADDLLVFTVQILEHFYTQPAKAEQAKIRRAERRAKSAPAEPTPPAH